MSALCGIFKLDGSQVERIVLEKMVESLAHRGLDGHGQWLSGAVGLGHQLFCITPESLGEKLPYYDLSAQVVITADARIDNREELFAKLNISHTDQAGMTDSMLILRSYQKWGKDCPKQLLGEFVFVIWDEVKQEMICVTDHMCNKPLYYCHTSEYFIFASEIRAIHTIPGIARRPNLRKIAMIGMRGIEKESTYFENVYLAPGATVISVNTGGIRKVEYWSPDIEKRLHLRNEAEYVEAFQEIFMKALAARLRSAFPVATLFSGGLDSSAITGTAARILAGEGRRLLALSAVLPENDGGKFCDERQYIDLLLGQANLDIKYVTDPWRGPFDNLERLIWSGESPFYTSRHYLYSAFADVAVRNGVRVILDGDGGELGPTFYGQGYYAELFLKGHWLSLLRDMEARGRIEKLPWLSLLKSEVIKPLIPPSWIRQIKPNFDLKMLRQASVLRTSFIEKQLGRKSLKEYQLLYNSLGDVLPNHRKNQLKGMNLRRWARVGTLFTGYEKTVISSPFFDKRIIEFCLALPGTMKINKGYRRYMIRAGMQGILPDAIRFRTTKEPFSPDYHERYNRQRNEMKSLIKSLAKSSFIKEIVDVEKLQTMLAYSMQTNRCSTPDEFNAMHNVPQGVYLMTFLNTFQ